MRPEHRDRYLASLQAGNAVTCIRAVSSKIPTIPPAAANPFARWRGVLFPRGVPRVLRRYVPPPGQAAGKCLKA